MRAQKAITEQNLGAAISRREAQRATLSWRLREIYKFGRDRRFEALLSSASFAGLVQRGDFFQRILEADRALLGQIQGETQRITVHPKIPGLPAYDIVPPQGGKLPQDDKSAGQRVWLKLDF